MAPVPREVEPTPIPSLSSELKLPVPPPSVADTTTAAEMWDWPGVSCEQEGALVRGGGVEVGVDGLTQSWAGLEALPCVTNTGTVCV